MKKPNIVLMCTDTQRWDTLRCMGSPFAKSPGADRMSREGVLFTQGHTSSPVCMAIGGTCLVHGSTPYRIRPADILLFLMLYHLGRPY